MSTKAVCRLFVVLMAALAVAPEFASSKNLYEAPTELCPGEEGKIEARFCPAPEQRSDYDLVIVPVSGELTPTLEIISCVEFGEGEGYSCIVRAGPNPGVVRATVSAVDGRSYSSLIEIGGGVGSGCTSCGDSSTGGPSIGSEAGDLVGGPYLQLNLGTVRDDWYESSHPVRLVLSADQPSADLFTPDALELIGLPEWCYWTVPGSETSCLLCDNRGETGTCQSDCADPAHRVVYAVEVGDNVAFVREAEVDPNGYYLTIAEGGFTETSDCCCVDPLIYTQPLKRWHIYSPNQDPNELIIERLTPADVVEKTYHYESLDGDRDWRLSIGDDSGDFRQTSQQWAYDSGLSLWKRTTMVEVPATVGGWYTESVEETHHTSKTSPWKKRIVDPNGPDPQVTERELYKAAAGVFEGSVKWQTNPDGSWTWHTYEDTTNPIGRITKTYRSTWTDDALPGSIETWTTYEETVSTRQFDDDPNIGGLTVSNRERFVQGATVEKYASLEDPGDPNCRLERQYATAGSYLETTVCYAPEPTGNDPYNASERPWIERTNPNGVVETRDGGPSICAPYFDDTNWTPDYGCSGGNDDYQRNTWTRSAPATDGFDVYDLQGRLLVTGQRWDGDPQLEAEATEWTFYEYDDQNRVTKEYRSDYTVKEITWNDCCNSRTVTDTYGRRTEYQYDPAGRIQWEITEVEEQSQLRREITAYEYAAVSYDGRNLPSVTVSRGYDTLVWGSDITGFTVLRQSRTIHDLAGRVVAEVAIDLDTQGGDDSLTTEYAYGHTAAGGREVTMTRPDGKTEIRSYHRDGRLKSITGTGVIPQLYVYSVAAGELTTTVYVGPDGTNSDRFTSTTVDMLGRTIREVRPAWTDSSPATLTTTYTYDSTTGELESVTTSDGQGAIGSPQYFETDYQTDKKVQRAGIDVDGGGFDPGDIADPEEADRYTQTTMDSEVDGDKIWRVTEQVQAGGTTGQTTKRLVSGFDTVTIPGGGTDPVIECTQTTDEHGLVTTRIVTNDTASKIRKVYTTYSNTTNYDVETWEYGYLASAVSHTGVTSTYEYDDLGRPHIVSDGRAQVTTTYDDLGRVKTRTELGGGTTTYAYYGQDDAGAGQVEVITDHLSNETRYAYDDLGRIEYTWGHTPQPTWVEYSKFGEREKLHTYRTDAGWTGGAWPTGAGDGDVTTWNYHDGTGLLNSKTYDDGGSVDYAYTSDGRLAERKWARTIPGTSTRVATTYGYDPNTLDLTTIDYNDSTLDVTLAYDRRARVESAGQGASGVDYAYDYSLWPTGVSVASSQLYGKTVGQSFAAGQYGRLTGLTIGTDYDADYFYDGATGRLDRITGPGLPTGTGADYGARYGYLTASDLVNSTRIVDDNDTTLVETVRTFESQRNLIDTVQSTWDPDNTAVLVSKYDYTNDVLSRRDDVSYSGLAFGSPGTPILADFSYNSRHELTGVDRSDNSDFDRAYSYDPIGNREWADAGSPAVRTDYVSNELNQIHRSETGDATLIAQGFTYDADGNLTELFVSGDMDCDGQVSFGDINCFVEANTNCPPVNPPGYTCDPCSCLKGDLNGDGQVSAADINPFVDLVVATGSAPQQSYTWDAENRLVRVEPTAGTEQPGNFRTEFGYDYRGRRVEKKVYTRDQGNTTWDLTAHRKYVWADWLLLLELDGMNSDAIVRQHTWGLDLAGQNGAQPSGLALLTGAGGIGGLVATEEPSTLTAVYQYDANGNVGQVLDWTQSTPAAALIAHYDYDPYGNTVQTTGSYAAENPWRFSTKSFDDETGLGYWGYRYYSPTTGRWLSRDPIGDPAFRWLNLSIQTSVSGFAVVDYSDLLHLYQYVRNASVNASDALGLHGCEQCGEPPRCRSEWDPWCICVVRCRGWRCAAQALACAAPATMPTGMAVACFICLGKLPANTPPTMLIKALCGACGGISTIATFGEVAACLSQQAACATAAADAYKWCMKQAEDG